MSGLISLKKYLYISKIALINQMAYKVRFFSPLILEGLVLLISIVLWKAIFTEKNLIQGYTFSSIATYYALNMAMSHFKTRNASGIIGDDIKEGRLSIFLLKPFYYNLSNFSELFTQMIFRSIVPGSLFIFLVLYFPDTILGPVNFVLFLISVLISIITGYLIFTALGIIAFWTVNTWGVNAIFKRFVDIFGGRVIPLDFLPSSFQIFSAFLPFQFISYFPNAVYLGRYTPMQLQNNFLLSLIWIILLLILNKVLWKAGIKKYESVGI